MKRAVMVFVSLWIICFWTGCASSRKAVLLAQKDPIALVSVVSNYDINWKDEESMSPNTINPFARGTLRGDDDKVMVSNAEDLITRAEILIRESMAELGVINLADKGRVINSRTYQEARINRTQVNQKLVKPEDYRLIDFRDKSFFSSLAAETGIQRSMFVEFIFTKEMVSGLFKTGNSRADVEMIIYIYDSARKTLFHKTLHMRSSAVMGVASGVYSHSELMGLFESTIADACYEFVYDLQQ